MIGLKRAYEYFFYRSYLFHIWIAGRKDGPAVTSVLSTSLLVFLNALSLFVVLEAALGKIIHLEKYWAVVGVFAIAASNYFFFVYGGKVERIIASFANETLAQRKSRGIWCWIYVLATFAVFVISIALFLPAASQ